MKYSLKTMKRWFLILLLAAFALSPFLAESQVDLKPAPGKPAVSQGVKHKKHKKHKKHRKKRHHRQHRRNHRPARRKKLA